MSLRFVDRGNVSKLTGAHAAQSQGLNLEIETRTLKDVLTLPHFMREADFSWNRSALEPVCSVVLLLVYVAI